MEIVLHVGMEGYAAVQRLFEDLYRNNMAAEVGFNQPSFFNNPPGMKKTRGPDKKPRKKPEGSTPLQRAQRKRQSTLFVIEGAMGSILSVTSGLHPTFGDQRQLFLPEELEAIHEIRQAIHKWRRATHEVSNRWEKVKQNLAASVDQTEKKV